MTARALWTIDAGGAVGLAALGAIVYTLGVAPLSGARRAAEQAEAAVQARREHAERLSGSLLGLDQGVGKARAAVAALAVELAPAEQVNATLAGLTAMAEREGIRVDEISPGAPARGGRFTRVPIRLSGMGTYADTVAFLHAVNAESRDLSVGRFDVGCGPCAPGAPANLSVELVWFAAPAEAAGRAASAGSGGEESR